MIKTAIYAGTFDPLTLGHMDLIERGSEIFDQLILAVVVQPPKDNLFSVRERVATNQSFLPPRFSACIPAMPRLISGKSRSYLHNLPALTV